MHFTTGIIKLFFDRVLEIVLFLPGKVMLRSNPEIVLRRSGIPAGTSFDIFLVYYLVYFFSIQYFYMNWGVWPFESFASSILGE